MIDQAALQSAVDDATQYVADNGVKVILTPRELGVEADREVWLPEERPVLVRVLHTGFDPFELIPTQHPIERPFANGVSLYIKNADNPVHGKVLILAPPGREV